MRLFGFLMLIQNVFSLSMVDHYTTFINKYNKTYSDMNFDIFKDNIEYINRHNNQDLPYKLEMNQFTDLPPMKSMVKYKKNGHNNHLYEYNDMKDVPSSIDWREKNAVTHVKNQGECGSCWSFSVTGSVEGIEAIKKHKLLNISEQQLIDCSNNEGDNGCEGGIMAYGFQYIIDNGGICSEEEYPYEAADGQCNSSCKNVVEISDYKNISSNNETLLKAIVSQQPVSVAIQANLTSFRLYSQGVYSDEECGDELDHGVLIIGYGTQNGSDYWLIKNSWGLDWGEKGYMKMLRNYVNSSGGLCGIAMMPSYPIV